MTLRSVYFLIILALATFACNINLNKQESLLTTKDSPQTLSTPTPKIPLGETNVDGIPVNTVPTSPTGTVSLLEVNDQLNGDCLVQAQSESVPVWGVGDGINQPIAYLGTAYYVNSQGDKTIIIRHDDLVAFGGYGSVDATDVDLISSKY